MPNENDLDVLYSLINQSPDGYKEFYPQKEGETALAKWPFLAKIVISGTNRPSSPIQLRVSENIFELPISSEVKTSEIENNLDTSLITDEISDSTAEKFEALNNQVTQNISISVPVNLRNEQNSSPIPSFLSNQEFVVKPEPEVSINTTQIETTFIDTPLVNQNSQIISLFKRLEKK